MAALMYDAVISMGAPKSARASLLPSGQSLDLFVTLTDYHGYQQLVQIHDPPLIHELEHHHVLHFTYRRTPNGEIESDFELDNARGARLCGARDIVVPGRLSAGADRRDGRGGRASGASTGRGAPSSSPGDFTPICAPMSIRPRPSFIDGSVLNNRPFQEAISAIHGRPAYRQVDRRLVYIDPHPAPRGGAAPAARCRASSRRCAARMSDIPSSQPVTDELNWVLEFNEQVRRLARDHRQRAPARQPSWWPGRHRHVRPADLERRSCARGASRSTRMSRVDAGFAYEAYVRLKLASVRAFGAAVDRQAARRAAALAAVARGAEIIDAWALHKGSSTSAPTARRSSSRRRPRRALARWVKFLLAFDVKYRERRLHFLIEGQNRLYQLIDQDRFAGLDPLVVDRLKREFYGRLDALRRREDRRLLQRRGARAGGRDLPRRALGRRGRASVELCAAIRGAACRQARPADRSAGAPRSISTPRRAISTICWPRSIRPMASRGAARGAGQLSWLSVLGRADVPDDQRARDRRAQRDPDRPHQPAGRPRAQGLRRNRRASRASASAISRRSCRAPTARTTTCSAACTRSTG